MKFVHVRAEAIRTGEPAIVAVTVWMSALETCGVLSSLVIFKLNPGGGAETRAVTFSDYTYESSPPILRLETLQFGWRQANPTQSKDNRLDDVVDISNEHVKAVSGPNPWPECLHLPLRLANLLTSFHIFLNSRT